MATYFSDKGPEYCIIVDSGSTSTLSTEVPSLDVMFSLRYWARETSNSAVYEVDEVLKREGGKIHAELHTGKNHSPTDVRSRISENTLIIQKSKCSFFTGSVQHDISHLKLVLRVCRWL